MSSRRKFIKQAAGLLAAPALLGAGALESAEASSDVFRVVPVNISISVRHEGIPNGDGTYRVGRSMGAWVVDDGGTGLSDEMLERYSRSEINREYYGRIVIKADGDAELDPPADGLLTIESMD